MKFWSTSKHPRWGGRLAVAALMLLLWLGTFALMVSPELHRLLHQDSQGLNHNCLITQIQQHPLLAGLTIPPAPPGVPHPVNHTPIIPKPQHPPRGRGLTPPPPPPLGGVWAPTFGRAGF